MMLLRFGNVICLGVMLAVRVPTSYPASYLFDQYQVQVPLRTHHSLENSTVFNYDYLMNVLLKPIIIRTPRVYISLVCYYFLAAYINGYSSRIVSCKVCFSCAALGKAPYE